jgi:hypothetical protein
MFSIAYDSEGSIQAAVGLVVIYLLLLVGVAVGCGFGARALMRSKGRSGAAGFCMGFFLGLVGVIVAAVLPATPEVEAARMRQQMALMGIPVPGAGTAMQPGSTPVPGDPQFVSPVAARPPIGLREIAIVAIAVNALTLVLAVVFDSFDLQLTLTWRPISLIIQLVAVGVSVTGLVTRDVLWIGAGLGAGFRLMTGDAFNEWTKLIPLLLLVGVAATVAVIWIASLKEDSPRSSLPTQTAYLLAVVGAVTTLAGFYPFNKSMLLVLVPSAAVGFFCFASSVRVPNRASIAVVLGWSALSLPSALDAMLNSYRDGDVVHELSKLIALLVIGAVVVLSGISLRQSLATASSGQMAGAHTAADVQPATPGVLDSHQHRDPDGPQRIDRVRDDGQVFVGTPAPTVAPSGLQPNPLIPPQVAEPAIMPMPPGGRPVSPSVVPPSVPQPAVAPPTMLNSSVAHPPPSADETVLRAPASRRPSILLSDGRMVRVDGPLVIGRQPTLQAVAPQATLVKLADPTSSLSRSHCLLSSDGQGIWVEDLGSVNGTLVNGPNGQEITLGKGMRSVVPPGTRVMLGDQWFELIPD